MIEVASSIGFGTKRLRILNTWSNFKWHFVIFLVVSVWCLYPFRYVPFGCAHVNLLVDFALHKGGIKHIDGAKVWQNILKMYAIYFFWYNHLAFYIHVTATVLFSSTTYTASVHMNCTVGTAWESRCTARRPWGTFIHINRSASSLYSTSGIRQLGVCEIFIRF
jgi:hypothetical protein